jgi:hypothetical protein
MHVGTSAVFRPVYLAQEDGGNSYPANQEFLTGLTNLSHTLCPTTIEMYKLSFQRLLANAFCWEADKRIENNLLEVQLG